MILADRDERYLRELRSELMECEPHLELITFTRREKLCAFLETGGQADILVADESFAGEELRNLAADMTRLVLSSTMMPVEGFTVVKKYQRMKTLLSTIMMRYAESSGSVDAVQGASDTRFVSFYSPEGGTGKTTLALGLAVSAAKGGTKVLYLNLEEIDSISELLAPTPGTLSDVLAALKTKGMHAGLKLKDSVGMEEQGEFYYISGVESISEFSEVSGEDVAQLLKEIRELAGYDLVVVDLGTGFSEQTRAVLKEMEAIFVPTISGEGSWKLVRLLKEARLHDEYRELFQKMKLVMNRVSGEELSVPTNLLERIPCCAKIPQHPVFANKQSMFQGSDVVSGCMSQILQEILEGSVRS